METTSQLSYDNPREAALLGYLAGILDGEGCIRINRTTSAKTLEQRQAVQLGAIYGPVIAVGMVDERIPRLLAEHFGGSVREERVRDRRSIWRWTITSRSHAIQVLTKIIPLLIVKREQAEVLLAFCEGIKGFRGVSREFGRLRVTPHELQRREDAYQALRKLNRVGAPATTERDSTREGEATVWSHGKP